MAARKMLLCGFFGQPWFFLRYGHSIYPYGVYVKKNPKYLFLNNRVSEKGHRPKAMPLLLFLFYTESKFRFHLPDSRQAAYAMKSALAPES